MVVIEMYEVVGIKFINSNRIYYFATNKLAIKAKDKVIVETEKGMQFGVAVADPVEMPADKLVFPLKNILRIANSEDLKQEKINEDKCEKALKDAKSIAEKLGLDMNFVDATFTFDRKQLIFNFIADERIDFRELAKKLAAIYKTRIELRQIGVRDKAKEIGGIGPCGRFLCCSTFLNDFNSVSINMAKNQYIALNPTKINGICGRLLCCLSYEDDQYKEMKKAYPPIGTIIKNGNKSEKVVGHNLLKGTYTVEKSNKILEEVQLDESRK